jgi:hypothetical protein
MEPYHPAELVCSHGVCLPLLLDRDVTLQQINENSNEKEPFIALFLSVRKWSVISFHLHKLFIRKVWHSWVTF